MPALVVLGFWIVLQFVSGVGSIAATDESSGGVAYMAHIGGFVSGVAGATSAARGATRSSRSGEQEWVEDKTCRENRWN
jgi:membrane associated rhomboid family serine protease